MKQLLTLAAAAALLFACGSTPVRTIENLKAASTGETNASAKYAKYAERATADSLFNVAAMFTATSKAEAIHAANHLAVLKKLGVEFTPVVEEIVVDSTLANLNAAKAGEEYEFTTMYPEFLAIGTEEGATEAVLSFDWANKAEVKHAGFYQDAITALTMNGNDLTMTTEWAVCPKCGDTYMKSALGEACDLCGTAADQFVLISSTATL